MVICLEWDADLHMGQLLPLPLTVSCFSKIQIGFTFLVPAYPGSTGQRAIKQVYVCMECVVDMTSVRLTWQAYKSFEIPTELTAVWRYLKNAYSTDAFLESCPADREIITHYAEKAAAATTAMPRKSQLMGEDRTLSIPDVVLLAGNGYDDWLCRPLVECDDITKLAVYSFSYL